MPALGDELNKGIQTNETVASALGNQYQPDLNAYQSLGSEQASRMAEALQAHPSLANSPNAMYALSGYKVDGTTLGRAMAYMNVADEARRALVHDQNTFRLPSVGNVWKSFTNFASNMGSGLWNNASGLWNSALGFTGKLNQGVESAVAPQQYRAPDVAKPFENIASGIKVGGEDILNTAGRALARATDTAAEIASLGSFNPNFSSGSLTNEQFGNIGSSLPDAYNTINNFTDRAVSLANPFSSDNAFMLMNHTIAFYESMKARYGSAYAMGYALPAIIAGVMTDGALNPAETEIASDASIVARAEQAVKSGKTLTQEEASVLDAAQKRIAREEEAKATREAGRQGGSKARFRTADISETLTKPVSYVSRGLRSALSPNRAIPANIAYLTTQEMARQDPSLAKLWELTKSGWVYDASGRPISTMGQSFAKMLGFDKTSPEYNIISGLTDAYTKYIGTDPFGVIGGVVGKARSYEGFTGALGNFFGGLGVRSADDMTRAFKEYRSVRNAFVWMAGHNAAQIADRFRGIYSPAILGKLAEARTAQDVLKIHEDIAEAFAMMGAKAPTMGMYSELKAGLVNGLGNIGARFATDDAFVATIKDQLDKGKVEATALQKSAAYIGANDSVSRWRSIFGRWVATRLTNNPRYFNTLANAVESRRFVPGDVNAIGAIQDMARLGLLPETTINAISDILLRTQNREDYVNIYKQLCTHIVTRRVLAGLSDAKYDSIKSLIIDRVWKEISAHVGYDGGGPDGVYINSPDGFVRSKVGVGENVQAAAVDNRQLGSLKFINANDVNRMVTRIRKATDAIAADGVNLSHAITDLNDAKLQAIMMARGVTFENIVTEIRDVLNTRLRTLKFTDVSKLEADGQKAYRERAIQTARELRGLLKNDKKVTVEKIIQFHDAVNQRYGLAINTLRKVEDYIALNGEVTMMAEDAVKEFGARMGASDIFIRNGQVLVDSTLVDRLNGETQALSDISLGFNQSILKGGKDYIEKIRSDVEFITDRREAVADAKKKAEQNYTRKVNEMSATRMKGRNPWQLFVDGNNMLLSKLFVPMALFSARWAQHVGVSEASINTFRNGPWSMFDSYLSSSISRHEIHGFPLSRLKEAGLYEEGKHAIGPTLGSEPSFIRHVVAGALMGLERNVLDISRTEAQRMVDNFTSAIMRHGGHLPGGMHDDADLISSAHKIGEKVQAYQVDQDGKITPTNAVVSSELVAHDSQMTGYTSALSSELGALASPTQMGNAIVHALFGKLMTEGADLYARDPEAAIREATKRTNAWLKSSAGREAMGAIEQSVNDAFDRIVANKQMTDLNIDQLEELRKEFLQMIPDAESILRMDLKPYMQHQWDIKTRQIEQFDKEIETRQIAIQKLKDQIAAEEARVVASGKKVSAAADAQQQVVDALKVQLQEAENTVKDFEQQIKNSPFRIYNGHITDEAKDLIAKRAQAAEEIKQARLGNIESLESIADTASGEGSRMLSRRDGGYFVVDSSPRPYDRSGYSAAKDTARGNFTDFYEPLIKTQALPGLAEVLGIKFGGWQRWGSGASFEDLMTVTDEEFPGWSAEKAVTFMVENYNTSLAADAVISAIKKGGMQKSFKGSLDTRTAWNYLESRGLVSDLAPLEDIFRMGRSNEQHQIDWVRRNGLDKNMSEQFFSEGKHLLYGRDHFDEFRGLDDFREWYDTLIASLRMDPTLGGMEGFDEKVYADIDRIFFGRLDLTTLYEKPKAELTDEDHLKAYEAEQSLDANLPRVHDLAEDWASQFFGGMDALRAPATEMEVANASARDIVASPFGEKIFVNSNEISFQALSKILGNVENGWSVSAKAAGQNDLRKVLSFNYVEGVPHEQMLARVRERFQNRGYYLVETDSIKNTRFAGTERVSYDMPRYYVVKPDLTTFTDQQLIDAQHMVAPSQEHRIIQISFGGAGKRPETVQLSLDPRWDPKAFANEYAVRRGNNSRVITFEEVQSPKLFEGGAETPVFANAPSEEPTVIIEIPHYFYDLINAVNLDESFQEIRNLENLDLQTPELVSRTKKVARYKVNREQFKKILSDMETRIDIYHDGDEYTIGERGQYRGLEARFQKLNELYKSMPESEAPKALEAEYSPPTAPYGHPQAPSHGDARFRSADDVWAQMEKLRNQNTQDNADRIQYEALLEQQRQAQEQAIKLRRVFKKAQNKAITADGNVGARIPQLQDSLIDEEDALLRAHTNRSTAIKEQADIASKHSDIAANRALRVYQKKKMSVNMKNALMDRNTQSVLKKLMPQMRHSVKTVANHYNQTLANVMMELAAGQYKSRDAVEGLTTELQKVALSEIRANPNKDAFLRSRETTFSAEHRASDDPEQDWAHQLTRSVMGTVMGNDGEGYKLHPSLIEQAVTGNIQHGRAMADTVSRMGPTAPSGIIGRSMSSTSFLREGVRGDLLQRISEKGHEAVLGPIVNSIVRHPTFLLEYHRQFERLRPLIDSGVLTEMEAEVKADTNAMINMHKFVHNPEDKTAWEMNMRVAAPFYFAQNQAWRRAFRLMGEDPGAFERYLKVCLGVTNYISGQKVLNGNSVYLPGSSILSYMTRFSPVFGNALPGFGSSMSFGLAGSPGSVSSMDPTGADISLSGLATNIFRPAFGPLVTVLGKELVNTFFAHDPSAHKILKAVIGDMAYNSSLLQLIAPSSQIKDIVNVTNSNSSVMLSAQNQVLNNYIDELFASTRRDVLNKYDWSSYKGKALEQALRAETDFEVSSKLNNTAFCQKLLEDAHNAARWMYVTRAVIDLGSPLALQLQQRFSLQPELDALMKKTGSMTQAMDEFVTKHPDHIADLTSHTANTYGPWPETVSASNMLDNHLDVVSNHPYATAYLVSNGSAYDPQSLQTELMSGLRSRETPIQYLNNIRVAIGNDYYYNYLLPQAQSNPAWVSSKTITLSNGKIYQSVSLSYEGSRWLSAQAKQYGNNFNPTWYDDHTGANRKDTANAALKDMEALLSSTSAKKVMSSYDIEAFNLWIKEYNSVQQQVITFKNEGNHSAAYALEDQWYAECTAGASEPALAKQAYFIQSVLRKMPGT